MGNDGDIVCSGHPGGERTISEFIIRIPLVDLRGNFDQLGKTTEPHYVGLDDVYSAVFNEFSETISINDEKVSS